MRSSIQEPLSARQVEIAGLVARGKSTREIANELFLSPRTVENHIAAIFNKMGVGSRAELIATLLTSSAGETGTPSPSGGVRAAKTNLPVSRTSLIGREADILELGGILSDHRLVSVIGSGGIGKTRIALAVGAAFLETTRSSVWFVDLAPLTHGSFVAAAVATALGVRESPSRPLLSSLVEHLNERAALIVLDNCEHVIADAALLGDALLRDCPQTRILATSREPLRIAGEQTYRLPSLRTPTKEQSRRLTAAAAADFAAIDLFVQRAKACERAFTLDDENAPVVAELCRRLDGIALAIELAAARVNILPLRALATKLDLLFRVLTSGDRTVLPRHQTMRALIDWSYDLLTSREQCLFERLSMFAGGCDLTSATAVYDSDEIDELGVMEVLSSLIDKSLVSVELHGREPRYRLLESSRQYAREKLTARGEFNVVAQRHARAFLDLAERLERDYDTGPDLAWLARAEPELENWRAALDWALTARGDVVLGQRLAGVLAPVWTNLSRVEGRRWLAAARERISDATPPSVVADLDYAGAQITRQFGEWESALSSGLRLIDVYRGLGDRGKIARAQHVAGQALVTLGRSAEGEPLLRSALDIARSLHNRRLEGLALEGLSLARSLEGNIVEARANIGAALAIWRQLGAQRNAAVAATILAEAEFRAGNIPAAFELAATLIQTLRGLGFTPFLTPFLAQALLNLAAYEIARDQWDVARAHAREALGHASESQLNVPLAWALQRLSAIAALSDHADAENSARVEAATRLIGHVDTCLTSLGAPREFTDQQEYERVMTLLRGAIDARKFEQLLTAGAMLTTAEAIDLALSI